MSLYTGQDTLQIYSMKQLLSTLQTIPDETTVLLEFSLTMRAPCFQLYEKMKVLSDFFR